MSLRTVTALLTVTACMIVVSCSGKGRSADQDFYFTTLKTGGEERVSFDIDLSDTTCIYGISLVSRFKKDAECSNVTFTVSLTSPSGQSGSERVTLSSDYRTVKEYIRNNPEDGRIQAASAPGYYDISWLYRMDEVIGKEHPLKGNWDKEVFHNGNPIVLELGCGKGEYTIALAERFPNKNYIGVDIKGARLWRGAKYAHEHNMPNVAFLRTRIDFIDSLFGPDEVSEIWLTFSDPPPWKS